MQSAEYISVTLDGKTLRYVTINGTPFFRYRDVCRLLNTQTTMTRHIEKLHLDESDGYFIAPEHPKYDRKAYFVTVPVMFKIINHLETYIVANAEHFKAFCEKTFDMQCDWQPDSEVKRCLLCGKLLHKQKDKRNNRRLYCSDECSRIAHHKMASERWYAAKAARNMSAVCLNCGKTFEKDTPTQIYCCSLCGMLYRKKKQQEFLNRPKSNFYNPREVYRDRKEPVWLSASSL